MEKIFTYKYRAWAKCGEGINWWELSDDIDVAKTIHLLTRKYNRSEFSRYTFGKFAKRILGALAYKTFVAKLGFSDFEDADAYDVLHYYGLEDNLKGGTGTFQPLSRHFVLSEGNFKTVVVLHPER